MAERGRYEGIREIKYREGTMVDGRKRMKCGKQRSHEQVGPVVGAAQNNDKQRRKERKYEGSTAVR